jgi:hypothetical protein
VGVPSDKIQKFQNLGRCIGGSGIRQQKPMRIALTFCICTVSASIAYYFAFCLPRAHDREMAERFRGESLEFIRRCNDDGMRYYKEQFELLHDNSFQMWTAPEFHFNRHLKTCLIYMRYKQYFENNVFRPYYHNYVIDVYSNRHVVDGYYSSDPSSETNDVKLGNTDTGVPNYTIKQFLEEKKRLFSE